MLDNKGAEETPMSMSAQRLEIVRVKEGRIVAATIR